MANGTGTVGSSELVIPVVTVPVRQEQEWVGKAEIPAMAVQFYHFYDFYEFRPVGANPGLSEMAYRSS